MTNKARSSENFINDSIPITPPLIETLKKMKKKIIQKENKVTARHLVNIQSNKRLLSGCISRIIISLFFRFIFIDLYKINVSHYYTTSTKN
jgi:hypothetical protein